MSEAQDFVEVNVQPLGQDNAFSIELHVLDSSLNPEPFLIILGFQLEEGEIPGLNDDAANDPEQIIDLAKGLLLCDSGEMPPFADIPEEECPQDHKGFYYGLDIEMELEAGDSTELKEQQWQVSVFQPPTETPIDNERLFAMIQDFFKNHL